MCTLPQLFIAINSTGIICSGSKESSLIIGIVDATSTTGVALARGLQVHYALIAVLFVPSATKHKYKKKHIYFREKPNHRYSPEIQNNTLGIKRT